MNALLIAGVIGVVIWFQHRRRAVARRAHRASDYALSHALRSSDSWR
jgi:hypothetical protein